MWSQMLLSLSLSPLRLTHSTIVVTIVSVLASEPALVDYDCLAIDTLHPASVIR